MSTSAPLDRERDHGFTLVEVVVAIVLVGALSAVAVVGVGSLVGSGTDAACTTSRDAASAAAQVHLGSTGASPVTFAEMVASGALTLAPDHTLDPAGTTLAGDGWQLVMTPGAPPGFSCANAAPATTAPSPTTSTPATSTPATSTPTSTSTSTSTSSSTTVPMFAGPTEPMRLCLESSTGALLAGATLSIYAGTWFEVGTTGSSACLDVDIPDSTSAVAVRHRGVYQQLDWSAGTPSAGTTVFTFETSPHAVRLVDSSGQGIAGATSEFYAGSWQPLGTTDANGCVVTELLTGYLTFSMRHRGVYQQQTVDTSSGGTGGCGTAPVVATFETQPRYVQARSATTQPVAGVAVTFYAGSWQPLGTTGADGCVSIELLPGAVSFGGYVESVYRQVDLTLTATSITSCASAAVLGP